MNKGVDSANHHVMLFKFVFNEMHYEYDKYHDCYHLILGDSLD